MNTQLKMFQAGFGAYSRILPQAAAHSAVDLLMTPRIPEDRRAGEPRFVSDVQPLGDQAFVSTYGTGPIRVLLVHGWSGWLGQFSGLLDRLDPDLYTLYGLHPAGHGHSTARRSNPGRFIKGIEALCDHPGKPFDLAIGHSMGAGALAYVAAHRPVFRRLVLVAGPASIEGVLDRFARFLRLGRRSRRIFLEAVEREVGLGTEQLDIARLARRITQPVLIIHDRDDREIPFEEAVVLHRSFADARLYETRQLGHHRLLRDPDTLSRILAFGAGEASRSPVNLPGLAETSLS